jgi:hypothetical protein
MNFELTSQQRDLQQLCRQFAREEIDPYIRNNRETEWYGTPDERFPDELWKRFEEADLRVDPDALTLVRTGFGMEDPAEGSYLSVCFAVERADTTGALDPGPECADARWWPVAELSTTDARIRSVDRRRVEAAVDRLREGPVRSE